MSVNDITGDPIRTDVPSDKFKSGWDAIWGKLEEVIEAVAEDAGEEPVTDEDVLKDIPDPFYVAFDNTQQCSPFLTQCPRCNNPSNQCDRYTSQPLDVTSEEDEAWKEMERK